MKHRYVRLRIAFALEGHGSATRFAADCNTSLDILCHSLNGRPAGKGLPPKRSWRLEQLAEAHISKVFAKHRHVLDLEGNP